MHSRTGIGRKWRRFSHKFRSGIYLCLAVLVIVAVVGLLIYMLSSPEWRPRW